MSAAILNTNRTELHEEICSNNHVILSHRTRKRIREAKKKARPGTCMYLVKSGAQSQPPYPFN